MTKLTIVAALLVSVVSTAARADQLSKYFVDNWCAEASDGYITSERMSNVNECEGEQQGMQITQQGYRTGGVFCRFTEVKLIGRENFVVTIKCPNESPVKARMSIGRGHLVIAPLYGVPSFPRM
jgi:hypothetical protein